ncbi:MAG: Rne/Rng family ribonuclease [Myxococcota bacterium]
MSSILVINAAGRETRVALVENGHIAEFYLERKKDKGIVGNIYKGRVVRVLPGMQAAFVDVGLDKAAFLYVSDVLYDPESARAQFELTEGEHEEAAEVPDVSPDVSFGGEEPAAHAAAEEVELEVQELPPGALPPPEGERTSSGEMPAIGAGEGTNEAEAASNEPPPGGEAPSTEPPSGTEVVAQAIAEAGAPAALVGAIAAAEPATTVAALEQVSQEARGERRGPRDQGLREKSRRERERDRRAREDDKVKHRKQAKIEDLLKVGQEVLVQISKDPIGTKGARLTSHISIPGRHLVFMPTVDHVGISRRISNEKERRRLREIVDRMRPPGTGFIVRTVAEAVPQEKLEADIRFLIEVWNETVKRAEKRGGPGLVQPELDLILRATRDLFAQDVEKLVIDEREEYERVQNFVTAQDPALRERVLLHDNEEPIFDAYGIEQELSRAVQRKVWLKSGGYLIIDQAEALTAIDVNSGRYVGKKSLEETITKINVEAAKEIVYQLRLRNIGGIIICDFIDMEKPQNRDKVFKALQEALGRDKAKTNVLRISELGLVEMTRKRVRESITRMLHEDCAYCDGQGYVKTATTVAYEIFRELRREAAAYKDPTLVINCNGDVARLLQGDEKQELRHLMDRFNKTIQVRPQASYHREQYDIYARTAQGNEHKVAASSQVFDAEQSYGAPKQRPPQNNERERERGRDRGRGRGRDRDRGRREGRGGDGQRRDEQRPQAKEPSEPTSAAAASAEAPASVEGQ